MSTFQKVAVLGAVIALTTTLTLPDRKTGPILDIGFKGIRGLLATAMGTGKKV